MGKGTKIITIIMIALFGGLLLVAQSKPENFKDKLKKIKNGEKVVVTTSEGDVVFEGKDAEKLLKRFGAGGISWIMESDDDGGEEFIFISSDGDTNKTSIMKKVMVFEGDHGDAFNITLSDEDRDITIKDENGEKYVKDVFYEDGEKKVIELRGKEAEEYLEKLEDEGKMHRVDMDRDFKFFGIDGSVMDGSKEMEIEVEIEDGNKKITVTTEDEDGNETTKVYEGDEADEFLKKHGNNHKTMFFNKGKGEHKFEFIFDEDFDSIGDSIKVKVKQLKKRQNESYHYG